MSVVCFTTIQCCNSKIWLQQVTGMRQNDSKGHVSDSHDSSKGWKGDLHGSPWGSHCIGALQAASRRSEHSQTCSSRFQTSCLVSQMQGQRDGSLQHTVHHWVHCIALQSLALYHQHSTDSPGLQLVVSETGNSTEEAIMNWYTSPHWSNLCRSDRCERSLSRCHCRLWERLRMHCTYRPVGRQCSLLCSEN